MFGQPHHRRQHSLQNRVSLRSYTKRKQHKRALTLSPLSDPYLQLVKRSLKFCSLFLFPLNLVLFSPEDHQANSLGRLVEKKKYQRNCVIASSPSGRLQHQERMVAPLSAWPWQNLGAYKVRKNLSSFNSSLISIWVLVTKSGSSFIPVDVKFFLSDDYFFTLLPRTINRISRLIHDYCYGFRSFFGEFSVSSLWTSPGTTGVLKDL